jgi:hypothetical protein
MEGVSLGDFLTAAVASHDDVARAWSVAHGAEDEWRQIRLASWRGLAAVLPKPGEGNGPNGALLELEPNDYRAMWNWNRALAFLQRVGAQPAEALPGVVARLAGILAGNREPPVSAPTLPDEAAEAVRRWADAHVAERGHDSPVVCSATALLDFVRTGPLPAHNAEIATLLAGVLPSWKGVPMIPLMQAEDVARDAFQHALDDGLEGDVERWVAFYVRSASTAVREMAARASASDPLRATFRRLFARIPELEPELGARIADKIVECPVLTRAFQEEAGIGRALFEQVLIMLFAAEQAAEVAVPGHGFTVVPPVLALLSDG